MRTLEERNKIMELYAQGKNNSQISRETAIPRRTVADIVSNKYTKAICKSAQKFDPSKFSEEQKEAYAYILGQYLGDGCIDITTKGVGRLRIISDCKYPNIIQEIKHNIKTILPKNKPFSNVVMRNGKPSCDNVTIYSKNLFDMFPQHGSGKKHDRNISLTDWQYAITSSYTKSFLRGLIHSDGSRFFNKKRKEYSYQFTNCSEDIIKIYRTHLDKLNIGNYICQRQIKGLMKNRSYNIFTTKRKDVAILDSFIGAKS